ncbi:carbohydrate kinase [Okibacterium endophyticum]
MIRDAAGNQVASPGGSPLNVAVGLARLGRHVTLISQVGDDANGAIVRGHLERNGAIARMLPRESTNVVRAINGADGAAEHGFSVSWDPAISLAECADAELVHVGSIGAHLHPGAPRVLALAEAARERALTSYDPNCRHAALGSHPALVDDVEKYVEISGVVKASEEDVRLLYPGSRPQQVAEHWLRRGASLVVITRGGAGAWCQAAAGTSFDAPAIAVNAVDTRGAGDSFTSALLYGLAEHGFVGEGANERLGRVTISDLRDIVQHASRAAAIACTRAGAMPPTLSELGLAPSHVAELVTRPEASSTNVQDQELTP